MMELFRSIRRLLYRLSLSAPGAHLPTSPIVHLKLGSLLSVFDEKSAILQANYSLWRPMDIGQNATYWHPTHTFGAAVAK